MNQTRHNLLKLTKVIQLARSLDTLIDDMPSQIALAGTAFTKDAFQDARLHGALDPALFDIAIQGLSGATDAANDVLIVPVETTSRMYKAKVASIPFVKPSRRDHGSKEWIPGVDIFKKRLVVLPFTFVKRGASVREYHVCIVDMRDGSLHILSPVQDRHMHKAMVEVSHELLSQSINWN